MRIELDLRSRAGGFALAVRAAWDERVAAVFGPSGSGKSTLLEAIAGLRPAEGRIALDGIDVSGLPPQRRGVGWVPQESSLFPHLTAGENVLFGAPPSRRDARRVADILEIGALWERPAAQLSGGERQRVALARALMSAPRLLLLDEPLAALDLPLRARVLPYLARVRDELGTPMLHVSHDPHELLGLAGFALRLEAGALVAAGDPRDVLWSAAAAAGLSPRENRLAGTVASRPDAGLIEVALDAGGTLLVAGETAMGARVLVEFRAEDVLLAADRPGAISAQNILAATVAGLEIRGGTLLAKLEAPMPLCAQVTARAGAALGLREGARVFAVIKAHSCRALA